MAGTRVFPIVPGGVQVTPVAITPGASLLDPRPTSIFAHGDGTFDMTDEDGVSVTYPSSTAGILLPFSPVKVTAASTGVTIIGWGKAQL